MLCFTLFLFLNNAFAIDKSFIQSLEGKVMLNKVPATKGALVKSADEITTLANSKAIIIDNLDDAIHLINDYAPEHLIIACKDPLAIGDRIINAGSIFLGNYTPESVGDYASGTNHTLPTNGYARAYSGVSVDSFVKKITFQRLSKQGLQNIANTVELMAAAEGLDAHKNAVTIRINSLIN